MKPAPLPGPSLARFEALDFAIEDFNHESHVFVAWSYLQAYDLVESIRRYRETLLRLTAKLGIADKYHETITWFYLVAVAEAARGDARHDWAVFKALNPGLLRSKPGLVRKFYSEERLMSAAARHLFLLPDRA